MEVRHKLFVDQPNWQDLMKQYIDFEKQGESEPYGGFDLSSIEKKIQRSFSRAVSSRYHANFSVGPLAMCVGEWGKGFFSDVEVANLHEVAKEYSAFRKNSNYKVNAWSTDSLSEGPEVFDKNLATFLRSLYQNTDIGLISEDDFSDEMTSLARAYNGLQSTVPMLTWFNESRGDEFLEKHSLPSIVYPLCKEYRVSTRNYIDVEEMELLNASCELWVHRFDSGKRQQYIDSSQTAQKLWHQKYGLRDK